MIRKVKLLCLTFCYFIAIIICLYLEHLSVKSILFINEYSEYLLQHWQEGLLIDISEEDTYEMKTIVHPKAINEQCNCINSTNDTYVGRLIEEQCNNTMLKSKCNTISRIYYYAQQWKNLKFHSDFSKLFNFIKKQR